MKIRYSHLQIKQDNGHFMSLVLSYAEDDPIWGLEAEKRERQTIADAQRLLTLRADALTQEPVTIRS